MTVLGLIAGVSICISLVFWVIGAPLPFALLEALLEIRSRVGVSIGRVCLPMDAKAILYGDKLTTKERNE